jgi:hypothetical protein
MNTLEQYKFRALPFQQAGVRFILGRTKVPCTGLACPMCASGNEAKERVVTVVKARETNQTFQLSMEKAIFDRLLAKPTRLDRVINFFRRIVLWLLKPLNRTQTSRN